MSNVETPEGQEMSLLDTINEMVEDIATQAGTEFKLLTEDDVISYVLTVVKQRIYMKSRSKRERLRIKQLEDRIKQLEAETPFTSLSSDEEE